MGIAIRGLRGVSGKKETEIEHIYHHYTVHMYIETSPCYKDGRGNPNPPRLYELYLPVQAAKLNNGLLY